MATLLLIVIYIAFISLGLPDSLIGASWPAVYADLGIPISSQGLMTIIVACGTTVSSFFSGKIKKALGTGWVVAISVALTAVGLMAVSFAPSFWIICAAAIPMGIGGGAIDSALNNYVALNYKTIHMNLLHCFWGVGAFCGPVIISAFLGENSGWRTGFRTVAFIQLALTLIMFLALPLWKKVEVRDVAEAEPQLDETGFFSVMKIKGAAFAVLSFLTYCAAEQTVALWGSSYLVTARGLPADSAARATAIYFLSIAAGRLVSGFLSLKLSNRTLIRIGLCTSAVGALSLLAGVTFPAFALIGLGFAPIYPSLMQQTPERFGRASSASLIGFEIAAAYVGCVSAPPLFGLLFQRTTVTNPERYGFVFIVFLLAVLVTCTIFTELIHKKQGND